MFEFNSQTGLFTQNTALVPNGSQCYSGHGDGLLNPDKEQISNIGPLPRGSYRIGAAYDDPHLGPCVMHLDPLVGTNVFGRGLFRLHGDNPEQNHTASDGCIIAPHNVRLIVAAARDRVLLVYSGELPTRVTAPPNG